MANVTIKDKDQGYRRTIKALGPLGSLTIGVQGARASTDHKTKAENDADRWAAGQRRKANKRFHLQAGGPAHKAPKEPQQPKRPTPPKPSRRGTPSAKAHGSYQRRMFAYQDALGRFPERHARWEAAMQSYNARHDDRSAATERLNKGLGLGREAASIGEIAEAHELGLGAPERSWLRAWIDENQDLIMKDSADALKQVILGKLSRERALNILGLKWVGAIQKRISDGQVQPALSAETIENKGSDVPLLDTNQLRSAITHLAQVTTSFLSGAALK